MNFDSKEERYFYWWAQELIRFDIITYFRYQPKGFKLFKGTTITYKHKTVRKRKIQTVDLLKGHEYTADFLIYWNPKVRDILFFPWNEEGNYSFKKYPFIANYSKAKDCYFSVIDVKGTYNQNDAWRRFSIDQKWVFQNFGVFVQKIITHPAINKKGKLIPANALFPNTFIPERFLLTDKDMTSRKIKYKHITLQQFRDDHGF